MSDIRPYICSRDARAAIDWYVDAMGATITYEPIVMDDGRIGHVELSFGGATVMMSDAYPEIHVEAPAEGRGRSFQNGGLTEQNGVVADAVFGERRHREYRRAKRDDCGKAAARRKVHEFLLA